MMFSILAICVCLATLFMVLCGATLLCWPLLGLGLRKLRRRPATAANMLFAGRTLPWLLAFVVAVGLVLPAFMRFEPRSTGESMSTKLLLYAVAGALALLVMAFRAGRILEATASTEKRWRARSQVRWVNVAGSRVQVNLVVDGAPALLAMTGFFRPRIFVATQVVRTLSPDELSAALAHELAHVSFFDNLKRLFLKITRPPRWLGGAAVDAAWTTATEIAADEAALGQGASALDLASALVKMGTFKIDGAGFAQMAASHLVPDGAGSPLAMRIRRLQEALAAGGDQTTIKPASRFWRIAGLLTLFGVYATAVMTLLPSIHEALELLVR